MMYKLRVADRAHQDSDSIAEYISTNLDAPTAALDFLDDIAACYNRLRENPFLYEVCRDPRLRKEKYRRAVVGNYLVLYKVFEDTNAVIIYRIFYGAQNYTELI